MRLSRWIYRRLRYADLKEEVVGGMIELVVPYNDEFVLYDNKLKVLARDLSTTLGACIDYRSNLARLCVGDPVSGRHGGVEEILNKYQVPHNQRGLWGSTNIHRTDLRNMT